MIPAAFEYVRAGTLAEAISVLEQHGDDAKVLAGGHSLLPLMKLRLAEPGVLVDVGHLSELRGVRDDGDHLSIGAMTTHQQVADDALIRLHCGLLAQAAAGVGDPQVRHRGTIGGSIAHGDAAGDLPAIVLACDGELVIEGSGGRRTVPAAEFFLGYLETALESEEVLIELRVPKLDGWGFHYEKLSRVAQAWAIVGACALVERDNGRIAQARVGLTHMGHVPLRATATEDALQGALLDAGTVAAAAEHAADGSEPPADINAQPEFRRHLARVLTRRALARATAL